MEPSSIHPSLVIGIFQTRMELENCISCAELPFGTKETGKKHHIALKAPTAIAENYSHSHTLSGPSSAGATAPIDSAITPCRSASLGNSKKKRQPANGNVNHPSPTAPKSLATIHILESCFHAPTKAISIRLTLSDAQLLRHPWAHPFQRPITLFE